MTTESERRTAAEIRELLLDCNGATAAARRDLLRDSTAVAVPISSGTRPDPLQVPKPYQRLVASDGAPACPLDELWLNLPEQIRKALIFLLWRYEPNKDPTKKHLKVPSYTNGARRGRMAGKPGVKFELDVAEDRAQLATLDEALGVWQAAHSRWSGIGIALLGGNGMGCIDIDDCYDANGKLIASDDVCAVINYAIDAGCYIECSVSGTGLHIIGSTAAGFPAIGKFIAGSGPAGFEAYSAKRFLTMTAQVVANPGEWVSIDGVVAMIEQIRRQQPLASERANGTTSTVVAFPQWQIPAHLAGREIRIDLSLPSDLLSALPETEENIARVKSALANIDAKDPADTDASWFLRLCELKSLGWACEEKIAREWSAGGDPNKPTKAKYSHAAFDELWNRVKPAGEREVGRNIGSLFHHARDMGWVDQCGASSVTTSVDEDGAKDIRNGKLFAEAYRDKLIYVAETGTVLEHGPTGWVATTYGHAMRAARAVVKKRISHASELFKTGNTDAAKREIAHATWSSSEQRLEAMISQGWTHPGMSASLAEFDAEPQLLGVQNGVLDIHKRQLAALSPLLRISKRANVEFDPAAQCPLFDAFLAHVQPDPEKRRLLQQLAGLFLYGKPVEQKFIFVSGIGANGKGTFIELMAWMLGEYALRIQTEMLMQHERNPQGASPDIVALKGARLAYCNETQQGQRLDEARVKDLTGGDTLTGRAPYATKAITFGPSHNLVMVGNHRPDIRDTSHGMWRRMLLIGFDVVIAEANSDLSLPAKLRTEGAGVLNWALAGFADHRANGLAVPASVRARTDAYRTEQDIVGQWVDECCTLQASASMPQDELYGSYRTWAERNGHRPVTKRRLTVSLTERKCYRAPDKRTLIGIELNRQKGLVL